MRVELRSTPATTTSISRRYRPTLWQSRLPRALAERAPRVVTDDGRAVWMCEDRVIGRSGNAGVARRGQEVQRDRARRNRRRRVPRRHAEAAARRHGPRRPAGVGDLRAARARLPDRRPRRCKTRATRAWNDWAVEEFNAVGARSAVRPRVPARVTRPKPPPPSSSARAALGHRGAIVDVFDDRHRRPGLGPAVGCRASTPGCRSASTSRTAPGRSSATGSASGSRPRSRRCCRCNSTSRWRRWCSAARSSGTPASRSCSPSRASGGCPTSWPAWTWSGKPSATSSITRRAHRRASCSGARCSRRSRKTRSARSSSRCWAPTVACGRPTIRTPTARSPTRCRRSRRRWARCRRTTGSKITATNCARLYGFADALSDRRLRPRLAADAGHRRDGRVLPRTRVRDRRAPAVVSVYVGDQMINFHRPALWQREGSRCVRPPRSRRAAICASCGRVVRRRCTRCSTGAGAEIDEGPVERDGGRRATAIERVRARPRREPVGVHRSYRKEEASDAG